MNVQLQGRTNTFLIMPIKSNTILDFCISGRLLNVNWPCFWLGIKEQIKPNIKLLIKANSHKLFCRNGLLLRFSGPLELESPLSQRQILWLSDL